MVRKFFLYGYHVEVKKVKRMIILCLSLAVVLLCVVVGCRATRAGYESAPYSVVRTDGKFEVRDYPALAVVETRMAASGKDDDGSFSRLFGYITGANEADQKISMTTPVFMSGSETNRAMAFVMPAGLASDQVPEPADDSVTRRELPAGRFAVLRYSGARKARMEISALERLEAWMKAEGLGAVSSPVYGYFDPPWTPAFLRRNEVMLQVEVTPWVN